MNIAPCSWLFLYITTTLLLSLASSALRTTAHMQSTSSFISSFAHKITPRQHVYSTGLRMLSTTAAVPEVKSLLICGPSGVGKGTLINRLLQEYPTKVGLCVSRTSRPPRPGEIDGVHYHFTTKAEIEQDLVKGPFRYLEHAHVHHNLYGTREDAVQLVHRSGRICLLDLDTKGAQQLKSISFPVKSVFILPPSISELEHRLRHRGTEVEAQIQIRIRNAEEEIEYGKMKDNFDALLVNEDVDKTYVALQQLLFNWFPAYFNSSATK